MFSPQSCVGTCQEYGHTWCMKLLGGLNITFTTAVAMQSKQSSHIYSIVVNNVFNTMLTQISSKKELNQGLDFHVLVLFSFHCFSAESFKFLHYFFA